MNWFKIKTKSSERSEGFSFLGTDLHSHLIPGIDDGSPDINTSLALIKDLHELGYRKLITTPHIMQGYYPNDASTILPGLELLRVEIERLHIPVQLYAAAEYLLDSGLMEMLGNGEPLLTLSGKKVLVELSFVAPPMQLHDFLYQLQLKGYDPVIAHPERYLYYHNDPEQYKKFLDLGCELQVNLLSLKGHYGKGVKKAALKLIDNQWPAYLATDLHHPGHISGLQSMNKDYALMRKLQDYPWKNSDL